MGPIFWGRIKLMEIWENIRFTLDAGDVLRGEGTDPEKARLNRPTLVEAAETAIREGFNGLQPVAVLQEVEVRQIRHERILLQNGRLLSGSQVAHHLAGAQHVTAVICTIGAELEQFASSRMKNDPLLGLALDGLGNAAVEKVAQQVCVRLAEQAQVKGLQTSTPLSPGAPEWPVEVGQPQIFALLDPSKAGITLTSGGMMIPKKSISFVVGIGPEMAQTNLCEVCSLKGTCRYRHA
jgi:hypothetical protein